MMSLNGPTGVLALAGSREPLSGSPRHRPFIEMRVGRRGLLVRGNMFDEPIPLFLRGYDARAWKYRRRLVVPGPTPGDRTEHHQTIDPDRIPPGEQPGRHRAPRMGDEGCFLDRLPGDNEPGGGRRLFGHIARGARAAPSANTLQFLILTSARSGEVRKAT